MADRLRGSVRALIATAVVVAAPPATALALSGPGASSRAAGPSAHASKASSPGAGVRRLAVTVAASTVTVTGAVSLSPATAAARRRVRVVVRLDGIDHAWERRVVSVTAKDTYSAHWKTLLTGRLRVTARASVSGTASGRQISRTVVVTPRVAAPTPTTTPTGQPMLGLFKLTAGSAPLGQSPSGSYVQMLNGSGGTLPNLSSPSANKDYTTFAPGVDGGLSTVAYEPAPSPAFAQGTSGNALADDIVQPVGFEGTNFSVDTNPTDVQTGQADPIPQIYNNNGTLSGQITAWDAQWNGQSFNQGTPKPDGTTPAATTALSGTYDAATGAFTLSWRSQIVGGPFDGFSGSWHLAGTFVPASP
ncbi:MAG TPA: hypothetical protein VG294_14490 [Solirubrobacteraceae bacterium]|nr:hypothetical protein [Solirubrobacteraceae bacterium]